MGLTDDRIREIALEVKMLEKEIEEIEKKVDRRKQAILREMKRRKVMGLEYKYGKALIRISFVQQERLSYIASAAQELLGPEEFDQITKVEIDKEKLNAAVLNGVITPGEAAGFTQVKTNKPYAVITVK